MSVLIKNGRIVTAESDFVADLYINGEVISTIGKNLKVDAEREIDKKTVIIKKKHFDILL